MAVSSTGITCFHSSIRFSRTTRWMETGVPLLPPQGNRKHERQDQPWHASTPHPSTVLEWNSAASACPFRSPFSKTSPKKKVLVDQLHTFLLYVSFPPTIEFISSTLCNRTTFILVQFLPLSPHAQYNPTHSKWRRQTCAHVLLTPSRILQNTSLALKYLIR
jgi:hypothetical protein